MTPSEWIALAALIFTAAGSLAAATAYIVRALSSNTIAIAKVQTQLAENRTSINAEISQSVGRVHERLDAHNKESGEQFKAVHSHLSSLDRRVTIIEDLVQP